MDKRVRLTIDTCLNTEHTETCYLNGVLMVDIAKVSLSSDLGGFDFKMPFCVDIIPKKRGVSSWVCSTFESPSTIDFIVYVMNILGWTYIVWKLHHYMGLDTYFILFFNMQYSKCAGQFAFFPLLSTLFYWKTCYMCTSFI